jgi:hypothetical protein
MKVLKYLLVASILLASCTLGSQSEADQSSALDGVLTAISNLELKISALQETVGGVDRRLAALEEGNLPASEPVMSSESNPVDQPPESMALLSEGMGPTAFSITGAPGTVDSERVLRAQGADEYGNVFKNTIELGTEMMLAEPGSVLVGPDFDDPEMVKSTPRMDWISPITQDTLRDPEEEYFNAAEGEFLWFTGATVRADVAGYSIFLEGKPGHNWFLIIRGLFPDGKQDSDRNSTVQFTEYVPGHAQAMLYPPGAYISEGNFLQVAELSHVAGRNCGKEGCSGLSVFFLDLNTGAWVVIHQPQIDTPWEFVDSNWR